MQGGTRTPFDSSSVRLPGREALLALAVRCEAEEPSRALDVDIRIAIEGSTAAQDALASIWEKNRWRPEFVAEGFGVERYTSSLDAAVTLVPNGWSWTLRNWSGRFQAIANNGYNPESKTTRQTSGSTLALAMCAAALRARAG